MERAFIMEAIVLISAVAVVLYVVFGPS